MKIEQAWLKKHKLLQDTVEILRGQQIEAYLVGGAVRDLLLERGKIVDLDFAVPGDGLTVARQVANALRAAFYPLDRERGTGRVVFEISATQVHLDFATFRGPSLEADLADRDFTINAIALSLDSAPHLIDPMQGQRDLEVGQIRAVSETTFDHDPVRVVRAVRQAIEFGFSIEANTERYLGQAAPQLVTVSAERQRDELLKLLNTPAPGQALQTLRRLGVLPHVLPEVEAMVGVSQPRPHHLDVFDHTAAAMDIWTNLSRTGWADIFHRLQTEIEQYMNEMLAGNLPRYTLMPLALLLHDTGKPLTGSEEESNGQVRIRFLGHERESAKIARRVMHRFRFSNQASSFVETVVAQHMRPLLLAKGGKVSRRAIYRLFRDTGGGTYQAGVAVALHALVDQRATYPPGQGQAEEEALLKVVHRLLTTYFEQRDQVIDPPPLLTGRDLIEILGLREGYLIGRLLNRLKEAQATGQVTDKAAALAFIKADPDFASYQAEDL